MEFVKKIGRFFRILFWTMLGLGIVGGVLFFSVESIQKKVYDNKADLVGTNRTVTFYSKLTGEKVRMYTDKSMRFEALPTGGISVWLGSVNKKVHSNMEYIVEDN